jgi:hypothetical protein
MRSYTCEAFSILEKYYKAIIGLGFAKYPPFLLDHIIDSLCYFWRKAISLIKCNIWHLA